MSKLGKMTQIESNLFYLDSRKVDSFAGSGVYLIEGDGLTLIETGSSIVTTHVLEAVRDMGYRESDIKGAIVTHIHLDHAGGAGLLVRKLPKIKIYVHEGGAKHLADPTILIKSAKMVYGSLEKIIAVHGEVFPVPNQNLIPLSESRLEIGGGISVKIFNAPGHAPHHLCMFEPDRGWLFSGEALGHYCPESDTLTTAVTPPGFDFEASIETMKRILELKPRVICFSQYGQHADPALVIEEAMGQLNSYDEIIGPRIKRGQGRDDIIEEMLRALESEEEIDREALCHRFASLVHGFETYYKRRMKGAD